MTVRLNASPETPATAVKPYPRYARTCMECGIAFTSTEHTADFCMPAHRQTFNNRRLQRGAELYDLFMASRYQRALSKVLRVMTMLYRMAQDFRRQDREERDGRPSWRHPQRVLDRHPHLQAVATDIRRKGRK